MLKTIVILVVLALGACSINSAPEVQAGPDLSNIPDKPEPPECQTKIHKMVRKYLPEALRYPPHTAHRESYLALMDAEFRLMVSLSSNFERGLCADIYYYETQQVLLEAEERRGIK